MVTPFNPPSAILIIGSGVFGLSTAYALARREQFAKTEITVVSKSDPSGPPGFPPRDASSIDSSRIIRADYADPAYAALAAEALAEWRRSGPGELGGEGRYQESGLILVADEGSRGLDYVRASWENALAMSIDAPALAKHLRLLPTPEAIQGALGTGGSVGSWGYFNGSSGWADAGASMRWLFDRVSATGRVKFVSGTVNRLLHAGTRVQGATLQDGQSLTADFVVLAAGAWTPSLVDLSGQAIATGQVITYLDLTDEEQRALQKMPTILNLTTGLFITTPANRVLKIARHAYGYLNPTAAAPPRASEAEKPLDPLDPGQPPPPLISVPLTTPSSVSNTIPLDATAALRSALHEMVPLVSLKDRPFSRTRLCWYTDTPTGDFLIDYHPHWEGLCLATGGSGHAFKFLPVLGEKVVDCIEGRRPPQFADQWSWKTRQQDGSGFEDGVFTEDGSRGGKPGLVLNEELAKSKAAE